MSSASTDSKWAKATWGFFLMYLICFAFMLLIWTLVVCVDISDWGKPDLKLQTLLSHAVIEILYLVIFVFLILGIKAHERRRAYPSWTLSGFSAVLMIVVIVTMIWGLIEGTDSVSETGFFACCTILFLSMSLVSAKSALDLQRLKSSGVIEQLISHSSSEEETYLVSSEKPNAEQV